MRSLLDKLSLNKHFIPTEADYDLDRIYYALERKDTLQVEENLQSWIAESKEFLLTALEK